MYSLYFESVNHLEDNSDMDAYVESVMSYIDALEYSSAIESAYFTEASSEKKLDESVAKTVEQTINDIFGYTAKSVNDSLSSRLIDQSEKITEIEASMKENAKAGIDYSKVYVKISDMWEYYDFIDKLVRDHVEKFTVDKSLNLFNRVAGTGRAIDVLIKNLEDMSHELNKSNVENSKKMNKLANKAMHKNTIGSLLSRFDDALASNVRAVDKSGREYSESVETNINITESSFGYGPRDMVIYAVVAISLLSAEGIIVLHRFFKACPKTIKMKKTTAANVLTLLKSLAPDKFMLRIAKISSNAARAIGSRASIIGFSVSEEGTKGAVTYANKINKLIKAYAKFYISLVDYYIKVLDRVLFSIGDKPIIVDF